MGWLVFVDLYGFDQKLLILYYYNYFPIQVHDIFVELPYFELQNRNINRDK